MDQPTDDTEVARSPRPGAGVEQRFADPGLPAHVHRRTDIDKRSARRAERQVAGLFLLSFLGTVLFVVAFFAFPLDDPNNVRLSRLFTGLGLGIALFCIGAGAVHWAKTLMPDEEIVEERHPIASTPEERAAAAEVLREGGEATGFGRRKLIWGSLTGALGALALPAIIPLRDLWVRGESARPDEQLKETLWAEGVRLVTDPVGLPIRADEIPIGAVVHVLPEGLAGEALHEAREENPDLHPLDEINKAAVLLIRLEPEELQLDPQAQSWTYNGLVAYSKICTHVGCPVALYEQITHHLLCPCHQSTFDVTQGAKVIFGPAKRPLPQLAITVDSEGYLVAQHEFTEPVGPSFWERER
jgi:ubiquinol-cytochrome c reductase iron-sulfur subunit